MKKCSQDDPITRFCKATSECRESALFFLELFNWDLDKAISGFLKDELPPIKNTSPSLEISLDEWREAIRPLTKDSSHDSNDISHGEDIVPMPKSVNVEVEEEGSGKAANESTSIEIDLPFSDHDSDWD
ncbi:hypothetical protein AALP_AA1G044500 [Arabis alpina]|uniref:Uncharacterized protein n=1 Tax=Arabis alpina TaxID=50452 RepID=A0A087HL24_ARAAL|nr:hypothetical protein AALP_AA1G044500 [Arabis alpina]